EFDPAGFRPFLRHHRSPLAGRAAIVTGPAMDPALPQELRIRWPRDWRVDRDSWRLGDRENAIQAAWRLGYEFGFCHLQHLPPALILGFPHGVAIALRPRNELPHRDRLRSDRYH